MTTKADGSTFTADGVDLRIDYEADSITLTDVTGGGGPPVGSLMMPFFN